MPWFRGNLHTHTTNSDGDSAPDEVVTWYRDAGYDFLALTDHDLLTLPSDHAAAAGSMLLVHGEEVTAGDVHVNALGIRSTIPPVTGATVAETLQRNVDAVLTDGGMASVNHPNYRWQVGPADLMALEGCPCSRCSTAVRDRQLGPPGRPSDDALWDIVLTPIDGSTAWPWTMPTTSRSAAGPTATLAGGGSTSRRQGSRRRRSSTHSAAATSTPPRAWSWQTSSEDDVSWPSMSCSSTTSPTGPPSSAGAARSSMSSMGWSPGTRPAAARATSVPASTTRTASRPGYPATLPGLSTRPRHRVLAVQSGCNQRPRSSDGTVAVPPAASLPGRALPGGSGIGSTLRSTDSDIIFLRGSGPSPVVAPWWATRGR